MQLHPISSFKTLKIMRQTIYLLTACLLHFLQPGLSQEQSAEYWRDPDTRVFEDIQERMKSYYADQAKGPGSGYMQWRSWEHLMNHRLNADGQITNFAARNRRALKTYQRQQAPQSPANRSNSGYWQPLAPKDGYVLGNSGFNPGLGKG